MKRQDFKVFKPEKDESIRDLVGKIFEDIEDYKEESDTLIVCYKGVAVRIENKEMDAVISEIRRKRKNN